MIICLPPFQSGTTPQGCESRVVLQELLIMHIQCVSEFVLPNRKWKLRGLRIELFKSRMLQRGWCPSSFLRFEFMSHITQYFVSNLAPPAPRLPHSQAGCTDGQCLANQVNMQTYETRHTDDCDPELCNWLTLRGALVYEMLGRGLPVVAYDQEVKTFTVHNNNRAGSVGRWVAISHVWSHGLGNPKQNSMPGCQLQRIGSYVNNLYPSEIAPIAFWIDTLFCPTEPDEGTDEAIKCMAWTYAMAHKVLVLDSYLLNVTAADKAPDELATRILASDWTTRLWTYQEGTMNSNLYFQFSDGAVSLDELRSRRQRPAEWSVSDDIGYSLIGLTNDVSRLTLDSQIDVIAHALRHQSTSVSTDEALCLGLLLRLDMKALTEAPADERMKKLWSLVPHPPPRLVFWIGPRLTEPGFRWAPATLLGSSARNRVLRGPEPECAAYQTERGLQIQFPGMRLCALGLPIETFFGIRSQHMVHYLAQLVETDDSFKQNARVGAPLTPILSELDFRHSEHDIPKLALVMAPSTDRSEVVEIQPADEYGQPQQRRALLVLIVDKTDSTIFARSITTSDASAISFDIRPQAPGPTESEVFNLVDVLRRSNETQPDRPPVSYNTTCFCEPRCDTLFQAGCYQCKKNNRVTWAHGKWSCRQDGRATLCEGVLLPETQRWCID